MHVLLKFFLYCQSMLKSPNYSKVPEIKYSLPGSRRLLSALIAVLTLSACSAGNSPRAPTMRSPSVEKSSPVPADSNAGSKVPQARDSNSNLIRQWLQKMEQQYPKAKIEYASEALLSTHVNKLARLEAWLPKLQATLGVINSVSLTEMAGFQGDFQSPIYPISWAEADLDVFELQMLELLERRDSLPPQRVSIFISEKLELQSFALWNQFFFRFKDSLDLARELMDLSTQSFTSVEFHSQGSNSSLWRNSAGQWLMRISATGDPDRLAQDLRTRKELFLQLPFFISFLNPRDDDVFSSIFENCLQIASTYFFQKPGLLYPHLLECSNSEMRAFSYQSLQEHNFVSVHHSLGEEWYQIISDLRDLNLNYSPDGFTAIIVDTLSLTELLPSQFVSQIQNLRNLRERVVKSGLVPREILLNSSRNCQVFRGNVRNKVLGVCLNSSELEIEALFFNSKGEPIPWDL